MTVDKEKSWNSTNWLSYFLPEGYNFMSLTKLISLVSLQSVYVNVM